MKEKVIVFFLMAMGAVKVYENYNEEDDLDDIDKGHDKKYGSGKREIWPGNEPDMQPEGRFQSEEDESFDSPQMRNINWSLYEDEVIDTGVSSLTSAKQGLHCAQIADAECSCRRLICFGERFCFANVTQQEDQAVPRLGSNSALAPPPINQIERLVHCRHTILFGEKLCECKRYSRRGHVAVSDKSGEFAKKENNVNAMQPQETRHNSESSSKVRRYHEFIEQRRQRK